MTDSNIISRFTEPDRITFGRLAVAIALSVGAHIALIGLLDRLPAQMQQAAAPPSSALTVTLAVQQPPISTVQPVPEPVAIPAPPIRVPRTLTEPVTTTASTDRKVTVSRKPAPTDPAVNPKPVVSGRDRPVVRQTVNSKPTVTSPTVQSQQQKQPAETLPVVKALHPASKPRLATPPSRVNQADMDRSTPPASTAKPTASAGRQTVSNQTGQTTEQTRREARYKGKGLNNPSPVYPRLARRRGWQGQVMLTVEVSPQGRAAAVIIANSSGYPLLDEAALDAVRDWRFIPAYRNGMAVGSMLRVPVIFRFN